MTWTDTNREIDALVSLMDEPNDEVYDEIRRKIIGHGIEALPHLEEAWLHTFSGIHSKRLEMTIEEIKYHNLISLVLQWLDDSTRAPSDLIHLIAAYINENYQRDELQTWIDGIHRDCWLELNESLTALEKVKVLNHVFYQVHQLSALLPHEQTFEGFFFDFVRNNKAGNPMVMGILYMSIAQRLNLRMSGVNLPDQFVLAYLDNTEEFASTNQNENTQPHIHFYINPANQGAVFTKNEISAYLKHLDLEKSAHFYQPCSRKTMAANYLMEVHLGLREENRNTKAEYLLSLVKLLGETSRELGGFRS